jgi:1-acyl-sn-glycerol-3-phosphate acyltransferase
VTDANAVPATGAGIVYYNHIHWLDPVVICGTLDRYAVPLTKVEASTWPLVGQLLNWYHVIFVTRGEVDREALQATWQVLEDGDVMVISPEGTRSPDGSLQEAKEGLAFVARRAPEAWLIPCAVTGTPAATLSYRVWDRPPVQLRYGRPFRFRWEEAALSGSGRAGRETLRAMTDEAMVELAALLPDEMRGAYPEAPAASYRYLEFLPEGGGPARGDAGG